MRQTNGFWGHPLECQGWIYRPQLKSKNTFLFMVVIIKPTYGCNLGCHYCYLSSETKRWEFFDCDFILSIIKQLKCYCDSHHRQNLTLIWHGGEPLLWGIDNYEKVFAFMRKEFGDYPYKNLMQTNLTLLTQEYIDLFVKYDVRLGFSLDGPEFIHDKQRVLKNGQGSFDTVMSKYLLCKQNNLSVGCISVATKNHIGHIKEYYSFMNQNKISFKMNPLFISGEAAKNENELGISVMEYAHLIIELFDLMFDDPECQISNSNFVEIASNLITSKTAGCLFGENCQGNFLAISPKGEVFPCGRFCDNNYELYSYGNLHTTSFTDIMNTIRNSEPYKRFNFIKNSDCAKCNFYNVCHGGCLHDGFLKSGDFKNKTMLCPAYKMIFSHIKDRLNEYGMLQ